MQVVQDICELAESLAGELTQAQKSALLRLCQAVQPELSARLRPGTSVQSCYEAFVCATAYLALGRFYMAGTGHVSSFQAGNLKIENQSAEKTAQLLSDAAEQLLAPYIQPAGFAFRGVRA